MPIVLSADLGTSKITAVAIDARDGNVLAKATAANSAERTPADRKVRGHSEWDISIMAALAADCLRTIVEQLGDRRGNVAGIGITGQQHGVVVVGPDVNPLTPFINWQDKRGDEPLARDSGASYVGCLNNRLGPEANRRTGCRLATGYLAVTLAWLEHHGLLPERGRACFATDYFGAWLTGEQPLTDPTCAASGGVYDLQRNDWAWDLIEALALPRSLFVPVQPSGAPLGCLTAERAKQLGLDPGVPVFVGLGDHQASFLGSVGDPARSVLVNVGTGGQVAAFTPTFAFAPGLETRPFPRGGFVLVSAGLSGGAAYAVLERFFCQVGQELFGVSKPPPLYESMNRLAATVPAGGDGLRCEPFFFGSRSQPDRRAAWSGLSSANCTPGHLARSLLEGMARTFHAGYDSIRQVLGEPRAVLVGAGNGVRENPLLAQILATEFGQPLHIAAHPEEAAYGAALLAAVGAGLLPDPAHAGQWVRHQAVSS